MANSAIAYVKFNQFIFDPNELVNIKTSLECLLGYELNYTDVGPNHQADIPVPTSSTLIQRISVPRGAEVLTVSFAGVTPATMFAENNEHDIKKAFQKAISERLSFILDVPVLKSSILVFLFD